MNISVRQPYLATELGQYIRVCITREENISCTGNSFCKNPKEIKDAGNELFKSSSFTKPSLLIKWLSLAFTTIDSSGKGPFFTRIPQRACLRYFFTKPPSNTQTLLSVLITNTLSLMFRKINCLLELKNFSQIPKCLVNLYHKVDGNELERLNKKYTNFVENSRGISTGYKYTLKTQVLRQIVWRISSQKITLKQQNDQYPLFIANQQISESELLIVSKPQIYFRTAHKFIEEFSKVSEEVALYTALQRSFYGNLKSIPCLCHSDVPLKLTDIMNKQELLKKLERCLSWRGTLREFKGKSAMESGKNMTWLKQNCYPNCTFVHLKSAFVLFASKKIVKGETLTVDFFADAEALKRTQIMKDKLGFTCKCDICQVQKWPLKSKSKKNNFFITIEGVRSNKLQKQMVWDILCQRKLSNYFPADFSYSETVQKYLACVHEGFSWEDMLNIIRVMRGQDDPSIRARMYLTLLHGLSKYLTISNTEAESLLHLIR